MTNHMLTRTERLNIAREELWLKQEAKMLKKHHGPVIITTVRLARDLEALLGRGWELVSSQDGNYVRGKSWTLKIDRKVLEGRQR